MRDEVLEGLAKYLLPLVWPERLRTGTILGELREGDEDAEDGATEELEAEAEPSPES